MASGRFCYCNKTWKKHLVTIEEDHNVGGVVSNEKISWVSELYNVFTDHIGKINICKHHIKVKEGCNPVKHKLPFSVRRGLSQILSQMQQGGIIEPVVVTLWLSPIVSTKKRSGELHLSVDLRSVNDAIWVENFPILRIEDLITLVVQAKSYTKLDLKAA